MCRVWVSISGLRLGLAIEFVVKCVCVRVIVRRGGGIMPIEYKTSCTMDAVAYVLDVRNGGV